MNIKLTYHIMPWEIDYALLTFIQLKKSKKFLANDVNVIIDSVLNLSSNLIDWDKSKISKDFFVNKYYQISSLLSDYTHNTKIYDESKLYGHLDLQRDCIASDIDYYIGVCPDIYFNDQTLSYLIESTRYINEENFVITTQIPKMWDASWDIITNDKFMKHPYEEWDKLDVFDIDQITENPNLTSISAGFKWAGWFDLYSKRFYEQLAPVHENWHGYGAWDFYSMNIAQAYNYNNGDFKQYIINNQLIFEYCVGNLKSSEINGFTKYYRDLIVCTDVDEQRQSFNKNLEVYIKNQIINNINKIS